MKCEPSLPSASEHDKHDKAIGSTDTTDHQADIDTTQDPISDKRVRTLTENGQ